MKRYLKSVAALLLLLNVCIQVSGRTFSDTTEVLVVNKEDMVPDGARKVGKIKVTDGGFKIECGYEQTLEQAKAQTIKAGGNIIKIRELKSPDAFTSCYRLLGEAYYHPDIPGVIAGRTRAFDSIMNVLLPDTATYALLYVYRPDMGASPPYNVLLDDSVICRMRNSSRYLIKVNKTGPAKISARTESRNVVSINIQPGKAYFVKCSILPGGLMGRPQLSIIDDYKGFQEFNSVKDKPKPEKVDAVY
ncbi:hypothetical protein QFZ51_004914 [Chitinophaga sp. W3I9]|uniref:hypothetical protein n=1 Tax=Chitinophaga sp. W3I9 TaxID=3373924 RepID=UPI003D2018FB